MNHITLDIQSSDFRDCHIGRYGTVITNALKRQTGLTGTAYDRRIECTTGLVYTYDGYSLRLYCEDRIRSITTSPIAHVRTIHLHLKP